MSKDTVEFPWRSPYEEPPIPRAATPRNWKTRCQEFKNWGFVALAICVLVLMLLGKKPTAPQTNPGSGLGQLSIMVPVVAIPKGTSLNVRLLKSVLTTEKSFSKTQLLSVFTEEDVERVDDQLVAKKDLAPYRPIFWTALELKPKPRASMPSVQIIYSEKGTP